MRELGQLLRERRIELGIDLDEVQTKTKIRKRYLQALENGDWNTLPGEVYARGFVRSYAELLGLDGMALLREFGPQEPEPETEEAETTTGLKSSGTPAKIPLNSRDQDPPYHSFPGDPVPSERGERVNVRPAGRSTAPAASRKKRQSPSVSLGSGSQIAVVAGILVVLGVGWYYLNHSGGKTSSNAPGQGTLAGLGNNSVAASGNSNAGAANGNSPATNSTAPATTANSTSNNSISTGTGNNLGNASGPNTGNTAVIASPYQNYLQKYVVHSTNPMTVQVTAATGDCWLSVTSDGAVVDPNDTLRVGQSKSWSASQTLQIHVGAVQAISVTVNGVPVTLPQVQGAIYIQFTKSSS